MRRSSASPFRSLSESSLGGGGPVQEYDCLISFHSSSHLFNIIIIANAIDLTFRLTEGPLVPRQTGTCRDLPCPRLWLRPDRRTQQRWSAGDLFISTDFQTDTSSDCFVFVSFTLSTKTRLSPSYIGYSSRIPTTLQESSSRLIGHRSCMVAEQT